MFSVLQGSAWPSNVHVYQSSHIGTASIIDPEISPTPPLIFTGEGVKKCEIVRNLASFSTSLKFDPPAFGNAARYRNCETKIAYHSAMIALCQGHFFIKGQVHRQHFPKMHFPWRHSDRRFAVKAWDLVPVLFWNAYKLLTDCDCMYTQLRRHQSGVEQACQSTKYLHTQHSGICGSSRC